MPVTGSAIRRWVSFTIRRGRSDAGEAIVGDNNQYYVAYSCGFVRCGCTWVDDDAGREEEKIRRRR